MDTTTVASTQGALLIGFTISCMLYGVLLCQTITYFRRYPKDSLKLKLLIVVLWMLETIHLAFIAHAVTYYLIHNKGNMAVHERPVWCLFMQIVPISCVIGITQYVWNMRIWTLSKNPRRTWFALGMIALMGADAALALAWLITSYHDTSFIDIRTKHLWLSLIALGLVTFNDALATGMLCLILYDSGGIRKADSLVTTVMAYALNTGLLTTIGSVACLVFVAAKPNSLYYAGAFVVFTKIYGNSLLAMLNWRRPSGDTTSCEPTESAFEFTTVPWGLSVATHPTVTWETQTTLGT